MSGLVHLHQCMCGWKKKDTGECWRWGRKLGKGQIKMSLLWLAGVFRLYLTWQQLGGIEGFQGWRWHHWNCFLLSLWWYVETGAEFLISVLLTPWTDISLLAYCSVHCRVFSSLPGFYLVDACSTPQVLTIKTISIWCQMFPGEQKGSLAKNH